jgi:hypothetical protein
MIALSLTPRLSLSQPDIQCDEAAIGEMAMPKVFPQLPVYRRLGATEVSHFGGRNAVIAAV